MIERVTEYAVSFFDGEWAHCTVTRDKSAAQRYIDEGVAVGMRREHYRIEHRTVTYGEWALTTSTPSSEPCGACNADAGEACRADCIGAAALDDERELSHVECGKHGAQTIIDVETFQGFAGGTSHAIKLQCGCTQLDESDDLAAAR